MRGRGRAVAAVGVAVLVLAAVAFGSRLATPPLVTSVPTVPPMAPATPLPLPDDAGASQTPAPLPEELGDDGIPWEAVMQTLMTILTIVVAVVLIVLVVRVARRLAAGERLTPIDEIVEEPLLDVDDVRDVLQAAREQIGVDEDPNRVVVRCWEALETIAADAGVARDAAETATEYVVDMLARLDLPADAAQRLSRLYAAALFSQERLPQAAVDDARSCLDRLEAALAQRRATA